MYSRIETYQHKIFGEHLCAVGKGDSEHLLEVTAHKKHSEMQDGNRATQTAVQNSRAKRGEPKLVGLALTIVTPGREMRKDESIVKAHGAAQPTVKAHTAARSAVYTHPNVRIRHTS